MESIDALAKAVNEFEGGLVLVSHDMRLISQVANEIWICDKKTITKYQGDIQSFKMDMRAQMGLDSEASSKTLRGDSSIRKKEGDNKKEKTASVSKAKLEVIVPPPKKTAQPRLVESNVNDDDATATTFATTTTNNSVQTSAGNAAADCASPVKGRYIPPHLRKKMQQQES